MILNQLGGRLGVRLLLVVFLSIIAIETAILFPSYLSYQRDLQNRLEHVGRAIMVMALKTRGHASENDLYIYARLAAYSSELTGGALYRLDGSLIGHFGEQTELSPDDAGDRPVTVRMTDNGKRLEVVWTAAGLGLPVTVVGRMDAAWIEPELRAFVWRIAGLVLLISVFVGSVVMVIFNRMVLQRISTLRQSMVAASENPEAVVVANIPVRSRDELDDLARDFNGMISRIAQDIAARDEIQDELVAAKNEAEVANLAKSEFLAAMSHELRTPLNAILGFSDIMRNQYFGPLGSEKYMEYAEDIHNSGDHLLSLLSNLLDISAIEAGKMNIQKQFLRVDEIVLESLNIVAQMARDKGVVLGNSIAQEMPPLYADMRSLKQILLNLLANAIKFTPEGGEVSVTVAASLREMTFIIADNGQGIAPDQLPNLTDPFTRVEKDPHYANEGWGLGLAITKSLVVLHQGDMQIESVLGEGTRVIVALPLASPTEYRSENATEPDSGHPNSRPKNHSERLKPELCLNTDLGADTRSFNGSGAAPSCRARRRCG